MCRLCRQTICDSRCPNADDPPIFGKCAECGEEIWDGDTYYELGDEIYCVDCVESAVREATVD